MPIPLTINLWSVDDARRVLSVMDLLDIKDAAYKRTDAAWSNALDSTDMNGTSASPESTLAIQQLLDKAGIATQPEPVPVRVSYRGYNSSFGRPIG
jgi:hypothetical protein